MAYDLILAKRINACILALPVPLKDCFTEKKMFGGLAFLYKGKMTVGVVKDQLMARVISSKMEAALNRGHVAPMNFTGRALKEFVYVSQDALQTEESLQYWVECGLEHARSVLGEA